MHFLGRLDRAIYRCVTEDIQTDEVVIVEERITHIQIRYPGDYERFQAYIPEMIKDPDYILQSEAYATAFILKEIITDEKTPLKLILRLRTSTDSPEYKNSVITFQKVRQKEYNRVIRKAIREGKLLYKKS